MVKMYRPEASCVLSVQEASLQRASASTRLRTFFQQPFPPSSDAENSRKKCSLQGWLLNSPLDELLSNTPPQSGPSPPKGRNGLRRDRLTASQQLRHNPPPNPPMAPSIPALHPRNQHLRHPVKSPTQSLRNFQAFRHWTLLPRMRRHPLNVQAPGPLKTLRVQSNERRGS